MTQQRKPSDQKLKEKAILGYGKVKEGYGKEAANFFKVGYEEGGKFARDFDPWFYVEDGELPELSHVEGSFWSSGNVWAWIVDHGEPAIMDYNWKTLESGGKYYWEDDEGNVYSWDSVKCFMPIPQPKK